MEHFNGTLFHKSGLVNKQLINQSINQSSQYNIGYCDSNVHVEFVLHSEWRYKIKILRSKTKGNKTVDVIVDGKTKLG